MTALCTPGRSLQAMVLLATCPGRLTCWAAQSPPGQPPQSSILSVFLTVTQTLRRANLEDCALCQETLSSSELASKACDGDFEGAWEPWVGTGAGFRCCPHLTLIRHGPDGASEAGAASYLLPS